MQRVCERGDGLDELECLPHSFAVSTANGVTWSMFTSNEDEKVRLHLSHMEHRLIFFSFRLTGITCFRHCSVAGAVK